MNTSENVTKVHLTDLHIEHELWSNELAFYSSDIKIFESKLPQLIVANIGNEERLAKIEQFQNQMIRQKEVINELNHNIRTHEKELSEKAKDMHPAAVQHQCLNDHVEMRNQIQEFKKIYQIFKTALTDFIINWK